MNWLNEYTINDKDKNSAKQYLLTSLLHSYSKKNAAVIYPDIK